MSIMAFKKMDMIRAVNFLCGLIIALVRLGFGVISDKHTFNRLFKNLWIILLWDENKDMATNFTQV